MNKKKRILQANINNQGGAFSVAYEAQKNLQEEFVFDYFFPDDFVKNEVYNHLLSMGSRCVGKLNSRSRFLKQYYIYKSFYQYLIHNNYDTVHIHADTSWKIAVYYLAATRAKVKKVIVHSHSSGVNGHYRIFNYLLHRLFKPLIKNAKYRCACSDVAANWMFDTTDNVSVIRNGVDISKYRYNSDSRTNVRRKYGIESQKVVIGSISDFSFQKNPEFIFKIVKEFAQSGNYVFLFVGNRPSGCKLKTMIESHPEIQNVIFAGSVANVQDYLSAMDVFIMPSRFEGLPMSALEAQVNGLYTLVSNNISKETKCSSKFYSLNFNVKDWKQLIEKFDYKQDRKDLSYFLDVDKATSSNMSNCFKSIYLRKLE